MPVNLEQIQRQIDTLNMQKENIQKKLDLHNVEVEKLNKQKADLQKKIDDLSGNVEEGADAGITTATAGNISSDGGQGNFAPRLGTYKRKYKKESLDLLDLLFNS